MKFLILLFFLSCNLFTNIKLEDLDYIRSLSDKDSISIIDSGTNFCNDYFEKNKSSSVIKKYRNFFICKFSKKRNRFYIYMVNVEKKNSLSLKEFCKDFLNSWPEVQDHMNKKLSFQSKNYLGGFLTENYYNNRALIFTDNFLKDKRTISNEINNFIFENRSIFTDDNAKNNKIIETELNKIDKIYKKINSQSESDLHKIVKNTLYKITRYKIFVNDTQKFKTFSCNWVPGKGLNPYVKKEKFSEFENI